jgi:hypothetical protein
MTPYTFEKVRAVGFDIHKTVAPIGTEHKKIFIEDGVSTQNQATLNVYAEGSFLFEVPELNVSHTFNVGDTSLDFNISFPKDCVCVEKPLQNESVRYCISSTKDKNTLYRTQVEIQQGGSIDVDALTLVVVTAGNVNVAGQTFNAVSFFSTTQAREVSSITGAKVVLLKCKELT